MKRKMLSMLMALAMILSLLPMTALAADGTACAGGEDCTHVAAIGDTHYDTLAEAVEAAQDGQTVDLLRTTKGSGVKVLGDENRTITIDLHGLTYTVVNPTVGSTGTETNGFQLLKGSTVTFKNGTIKPGTDAAKILFQNYCNLTLDNVTVDCTGSNCQYVASNNCGNVVIKDSTLLAADGQAAFDLYYWPSNGYGEGVTVTVEGNSVISGKVEYGSDESEDALADVADKAVLTITGGTFTGGFSTYGLGENKANISISGGIFSSDVSDYLAPGMKQDESGKVVIDTEKAVAEVNGVGYTSLSAALTAAKDGDTVTLLKSSTGNTKVKIEDGRKITLNMNGFDAGFIQNNNISIYHGGLDITGSGKLYEEAPNYGPVILYGSNDPSASGYTTVTVGKDVTLEGWAGLFINQLSANDGGTNAFGIEATVYGTLHSVRDTSGAGGHALYVNGTIKATEGNVPRIVLDGATLKTELGNGMYLAGYAETTITDSVIDSSSEGSTGIELRAGKLTINGDTQVKGGTGGFTVDPNGNGSTTGNVAMAVVQHTTKLPTSVTINGGTFTGGAALFEQNAQKNEEEAVAKISVAVYGGTFQGTVYSQNKTDFIAGGTFSGDVSDQYIVPGMVQDESGKVVIDTATAVAEINGVGYTSLDAALAAAKDGDTIKLLKDLESSAAITIPAGVTLDGDGKTLTYIGGNVETPSNGAFLTAGGENVTIQNLTVETKNQIKHGVQFYSVKSGKLSGVTVNGGTYTSVIVNNSQKIILEDCVLNSNGYTNIEYAVGSNIADMVVPSLTVDNVTFKPAGETGAPLMIWVDKSTVAQIKTVIGGNPTDKDVVAKIKENVTNKNPGDVVITVGLSNDTVSNETVSGAGYPSTTSYAITVSKADNGTVTASRTRANKGLTVTLTVKADEGYKLDTITVTDKNGNEIKLTDKGDGKYTFTMPASAVTVKASFAKDDTPVETGLPFTDVKADDWFYEAVKYAYDNKLMDGTSSTTFAPLMTTNRAMVVTILWRLEGSPVVNYAMNFSDVESGVWYTEAVRWAAAEGIVKGYSDTVFAPDDTVTREQLATILYRYAGYKEYDVSAKGDLTTFADGSTVSTWAADGMTWAVGAQLITGKDGGKLDPTGTATRAEVATILMRFCENVAK